MNIDWHRRRIDYERLDFDHSEPSEIGFCVYRDVENGEAKFQFLFSVRRIRDHYRSLFATEQILVRSGNIRIRLFEEVTERKLSIIANIRLLLSASV